jgi:hypothetical protein
VSRGRRESSAAVLGDRQHGELLLLAPGDGLALVFVVRYSGRVAMVAD